MRPVENLVYADANATYPVDPKHYDLVAAKLKEVDGNPSSIHSKGRNAKIALEESRDLLAAVFGCRGSEVIFTSGATEGNNLIVKGLIEHLASLPSDTSEPLPQVLISAVEHSAIREPVLMMEQQGLCEAVEVPVNSSGWVEETAFKKLLTERVALCAVMHVNNELGTINDVAKLSQLAKSIAPDCHFHVDAVQMFGKRPIDWYGESSIDSAVVTAHKVGGYKGIGALYLASGTKLKPMIFGGGQERARRPGTENMPGIISIGLRAKELNQLGNDWIQPACDNAQLFLNGIKNLSGVKIHGDPENSVASVGNTVNFHVEGVAGDDILLNFDLAGICASSGSACSSGVARPSKVILALGYGEWAALNSVRTSFIACGSTRDVTHMIDVLKETITRVQSPGTGKGAGAPGFHQ